MAEEWRPCNPDTPLEAVWRDYRAFLAEHAPDVLEYWKTILTAGNRPARDEVTEAGLFHPEWPPGRVVESVRFPAVTVRSDMPEREPSHGEYSLLHVRTGDQQPFDTLPVENGDLIILRAEDQPRIEVLTSFRLRLAAHGKDVMLCWLPPGTEITAMPRIQIESLYARVGAHLKKTSKL